MCALNHQSKSEMNNVSITPFTSYELDRLERIQRFLVNVIDPPIANRVAMVGYDSKEHRQGWEDWNTAAGVQIPFEYHLAEVKRQVGVNVPNQLQAKIRFLDKAENTWFTRARNAIRRYVDSTQRDTFENAFFDNMPQQPEGPMVVGSMDKFLGRLESMKNSPVPGAKEAYYSLQKKGLIDEYITQLKNTINEVKNQVSDLPPPDISPEKIQTIATQRRAAYERLNLWYNDWADTFRAELGYHDLIRLGLTAVKGGRSSQTEEKPTTSTTPSTVP
jgi:hypothetical protein